uniref:Uncharacterized protein n=1 Tax=Myoviridae sp. ctxpQ22 TaxID=2826715 RepID=A0A8S5N567_9CAUD|nr:MAG TPA: hypothetical protein [Myoviridae sp. ctxpQ22]
MRNLQRINSGEVLRQEIILISRYHFQVLFML